jgi:hypothetical protein
VPPLVCIPGIAGTADVYYKQIMSLCMKVHTFGNESLTPSVYSYFYYLKCDSSCVPLLTCDLNHIHVCRQPKYQIVLVSWSPSTFICAYILQILLPILLWRNLVDFKWIEDYFLNFLTGLSSDINRRSSSLESPWMDSFIWKILGLHEHPSCNETHPVFFCIHVLIRILS